MLFCYGGNPRSNWGVEEEEGGSAMVPYVRTIQIPFLIPDGMHNICSDELFRQRAFVLLLLMVREIGYQTKYERWTAETIIQIAIKKWLASSIWKIRFAQKLARPKNKSKATPKINKVTSNQYINNILPTIFHTKRTAKRGHVYNETLLVACNV